MPAHRISHAVSRFVRSFQKKHKQPEDVTDDDTCTCAPTTHKTSTDSFAHSTTALPTAFFKQTKSLLKRIEKQTQQQQVADATATRFSSASTRPSSLWSPVPTTPSPVHSPVEPRSSSSSKYKRQHKDKDADAASSYLRLAAMLAPVSTSTTDASQSMRSVAVAAAVELLLQLWTATLEQLQPTTDTTTRSALLTLLQAIALRCEFDTVLVALATGACSAHRHSNSQSRSVSRSDSTSMRTSRRRASTTVRLERAGSFRVAPVVTAVPSTLSSSKKPLRRSVFKRVKRSAATASSKTSPPLVCLLARRYLALHHATLQVVEDAVMSAASTAHKRLGVLPQLRELLASLLALSFTRVPWLRERIGATLERVMAAAPLDRLAALPVGMEVANALPLFTWHRSASPACSSGLMPFARAESWSASAQFVEAVLADADARLMLFGYVVQQLIAMRVVWSRVPGFGVLAQFALYATAELLETQQQQRAVVAAAQSVDDSAVSTSSSSTAAAPTLSMPSALFCTQSLALAAALPSSTLLAPLLLTLFHRTNAYLPNHVSVCLEHLARIVAVAPAYFGTEDAASDRVDMALITHVFTQLLASEHCAILKTSLLFLLAHFNLFSHALRTALTAVVAQSFRHLFLHWSRDVRFCYFHVLLYLTYSGNRIVLGAQSDALVLGAEAAQLFELPGLVRTRAMADWDVFDAPLHALLVRHSRLSKKQQTSNKPTPGATGVTLAPRSSVGGQRQSVSLAPRPKKAKVVATARPKAPMATKPKAAPPIASPAAVAWVDDVPLAALERSVPEYRQLVQTYFQCAKQYSLHEAVPVPVFSSVKGA